MASKTTISDKKELQIVVIDDSDFSRKSVIKALENEGFKVVGEANSAEQAAQIIRTLRPNLVLADIVMPDAS